jgi:hypothetical protein
MVTLRSDSLILPLKCWGVLKKIRSNIINYVYGTARKKQNFWQVGRKSKVQTIPQRLQQMKMIKKLTAALSSLELH